jgi:CRP-like cAMP-binding protein
MSLLFAQSLAYIGVPLKTALRVEERGRTVELEPGSVVARRGSVSSGAWLLMQGLVSARVSLDTGGDDVFTLLGPGTWFNEQQALTGLPSVVDIVAVTPALVFNVGSEDFAELMAGEPKFLAAMLATAAYRTVRLSEALVVYKHASPALRLGFVLATLPRFWTLPTALPVAPWTMRRRWKCGRQC